MTGLPDMSRVHVLFREPPSVYVSSFMGGTCSDNSLGGEGGGGLGGGMHTVG
jgi:hypothetical protein